MAVNGKQKGNSFERTIANMLSERFKEHTGIPQAFRRNPDSGSFFGGTNIARTQVYDTDWAIYGDLICPKAFKFAVECKHYKTAPILNAVLTESVADWDKWLKQARQDSEVSAKEMLLIVRYNRTENLAFLNPGVLSTEKPVIVYKNTEIFLLDTVLKQNNSFFFV
jgi:hypothetical protein